LQIFPRWKRLAQQAVLVLFTNFPGEQRALNDKKFDLHCASPFQTDCCTARDESYLFVLVDTSTEKIVGFVVASMQWSAADAPPILYSFTVIDEVSSRFPLNCKNSQSYPALYLCHDYSGTSRLFFGRRQKHIKPG